MRKFTVLAASTILLSACAIGPDYVKPLMDLPEKWFSFESTSVENSQQAAEAITLDWWKAFNDPVLTQLEEEGLSANTDLVRAAASVEQARAFMRASRANFFPNIQLEGGAGRVSNSEEINTLTSSKPYNNFSLAATLDYEVDLWGRLRRSSESAQAQLLAARANQDAVRLAIASDIAVAYFNLRALDAQIVVTENTIKSRKESFEYQQKQAMAGTVNTLVYKQAEAELATAQALLPQLKQQRQEQETTLAILLGRSPQAMVESTIARGRNIDRLPTLPSMPAELPSTLLERRPDIQVAEQTLRASNAEIGVARADYFPRLSLSSLVGLQSSEADNLFKSSARNWQVGGAIAGPLLDFGRTKSNVMTAEARKQDALAQYQRTVQQAFKETLDAMNASHNNNLRIEAQIAQVAARAEALRLSRIRYNAGYINYLELLDAQRFFHQAQLDRIAAKRDRLVAAVNLYKALGGGWKNPLLAKEEQKPAIVETPAPAIEEKIETPEVKTKAEEAAELPEEKAAPAPIAEEAMPSITPPAEENTSVITLPSSEEKPTPAATPSPQAPQPLLELDGSGLRIAQ